MQTLRMTDVMIPYEHKLSEGQTFRDLSVVIWQNLREIAVRRASDAGIRDFSLVLTEHGEGDGFVWVLARLAVPA